jgi:acyl CoA:acetate/3-ketoacid CoA transferase beta subunit
MKARCALPVTAAGRMTLLMTNLGLFVPAGDHFLLKEIAPGWSVDDVQARTDAPLRAADDLREVAAAQ